MKLVNFEDLPEYMKCDEVKEYYNILNKKRGQLFLKRFLDIMGSVLGIIVLSPIMLVIAIWIKFDSEGPILFKQIRITQYGKKFKIYKFRTMIVNAESKGAQVTTQNDSRITRSGKILRKCRLDELPQIFNILKGELSFVGTRPEVPKYVERYEKEMISTLLLPAGVTSLTSIFYKDEERLISNSSDVDKTYVEEILPEKMKLNLDSLRRFSIVEDFRIIFNTVYAVFISSNKEIVKDQQLSNDMEECKSAK